MGSNPDDPLSCSAVRSNFARFEEEIDTAVGPWHPTVAVAEAPPSMVLPLKFVQEAIEFHNSLSALHFLAFSSSR
jgi:hypothetical protein